METSGRASKRDIRRWRVPSYLKAGGLLLALTCAVTVWSEFPNRSAEDEKRPAGRAVRHPRERPSQLTMLKNIRADPDKMRRDERLPAFLNTLDRHQIPALLEQLRSSSTDPAADEAFILLVRAWAETDPAAAANWVTELRESNLRLVGLGQVAPAWAARDLHGAGEWARSLTDSAEREGAMIAVGSDAVRTEPLLALELAAELPGSAGADELLRRASMEWASTDAAAAAEWARTIDDETLRAHLFTGIALASSETDPVAAATLAADELPPGRPQADVVVGVVQRWAVRDPAAAATWVDTLPAGTLRRDATASLMEQWARTAPDAAAQWNATNAESLNR